MRNERRTMDSILPCVRCGDRGGTRGAITRMGIPYRYRGQRWGLDGEICHSCYVSLRENPDAVLHPDRRWRRLADAVLAFAAAMESRNSAEQSQRFEEMVAMASIQVPDRREP